MVDDLLTYVIVFQEPSLALSFIRSPALIAQPNDLIEKSEAVMNCSKCNVKE